MKIEIGEMLTRYEDVIKRQIDDEVKKFAKECAEKVALEALAHIKIRAEKAGETVKLSLEIGEDKATPPIKRAAPEDEKTPSLRLYTKRVPYSEDGPFEASVTINWGTSSSGSAGGGRSEAEAIANALIRLGEHILKARCG